MKPVLSLPQFSHLNIPLKSLCCLTYSLLQSVLLFHIPIYWAFSLCCFSSFEAKSLMSILTNYSGVTCILNRARIGILFFLSLRLNIIDLDLSLYGFPHLKILNISCSIRSAMSIRKLLLSSFFGFFMFISLIISTLLDCSTTRSTNFYLRVSLNWYPVPVIDWKKLEL